MEKNRFSRWNTFYIKNNIKCLTRITTNNRDYFIIPKSSSHIPAHKRTIPVCRSWPTSSCEEHDRIAETSNPRRKMHVLESFTVSLYYINIGDCVPISEGGFFWECFDPWSRIFVVHPIFIIQIALFSAIFIFIFSNLDMIEKSPKKGRFFITSSPTWIPFLIMPLVK